MAKEKNGMEVLWKSFEKSGSVESYLAYFQSKQDDKISPKKEPKGKLEKAGRAKK